MTPAQFTRICRWAALGSIKRRLWSIVCTSVQPHRMGSSEIAAESRMAVRRSLAPRVSELLHSSLSTSASSLPTMLCALLMWHVKVVGGWQRALHEQYGLSNMAHPKICSYSAAALSQLESRCSPQLQSAPCCMHGLMQLQLQLRLQLQQCSTRSLVPVLPQSLILSGGPLGEMPYRYNNACC